MNIDETKNKVDSLLADRGLVGAYKEQAVRLLLYHLYIAIDIYRFMTFAEKAKAGYWYRIFKGSFSLTGFLKERKRKRDKEKSPLYPSYKKESGVKEKGENTPSPRVSEKNADLKTRQAAFWKELLDYQDKYSLHLLQKFYLKWAEDTQDRTKMLWELEKSWNTKMRLAAWSKKPFEADSEAAAIRLERAKNGGKVKPAIDTAAQQAIATQREEANAKLEQEIEARKAGAVSMEEYLKNNPNSILRTLKKHDK